MSRKKNGVKLLIHRISFSVNLIFTIFIIIVGLILGKIFIADSGLLDGNNKSSDTLVVKFDSTSYNGRLEAIIDGIIIDGMTDFDKYKVIHDFVVYYLEYDHDSFNEFMYSGDSSYLSVSNNPILALEYGIATCGGYAELYSDLCEEAGLESYYISGTADFLDETGVGHAWNTARVGGTLYHVDCCWDDTPQADDQYDWFMQGDYRASDSRSWEGLYNFSEESYTIIRGLTKPYKFSMINAPKEAY